MEEGSGGGWLGGGRGIELSPLCGSDRMKMVRAKSKKRSLILQYHDQVSTICIRISNCIANKHVDTDAAKLGGACCLTTECAAREKCQTKVRKTGVWWGKSGRGGGGEGGFINSIQR